MLKNTLITNFLEIISKPGLIIFFIAFVIFSYLLIALLTWSLTKPLKYLSIPFIIIGIIILIIRFCLPFIITIMPENTVNVPSSLVNVMLNPFLKSGIICLLAGILSMTLYILIGKFTKKKTANKEKIKSVNEEKKN